MEAKFKKNKNWRPIIIGTLFFFVFSFVLIKFIFQARKANDEQIADHIELLNQIFTDINNSAKIVDFANEKESIDFLTVKSFSGSVVGPLSLAMPEKWKGPYLDKNLTIEGTEYQIVRAKNGYYIIPGDGVKLGNGTIINRTFKIDRKTDLEKLINNPKILSIHGRPLAAKIPTIKDIQKNISTNEILYDAPEAY